MNPIVSSAEYTRPEDHEMTAAERHEIRERTRQREKKSRGWATRNMFASANA